MSDRNQMRALQIVARSQVSVVRQILDDQDAMRSALRLAAPVLDSFLNGQGAIEPAELDAALTAVNEALAR